MFHPANLVEHIDRMPSGSDRSVMARVALNLLYDPDLYPVSLIEVLELGAVERVLVRACLDYCAIDRRQLLSWSDGRVVELREFAKEGQADDGEYGLYIL
ncbi:hypothetical protein XSP_001551 [Xanthomonas euroxanthea]|uniref:Uncharacterized protein n=1 Tax=Xanthomonas euroxanthea TaxID=2259622 RepID=A0A8E4GFI2_9XANT|nr:hypothetical protein [Xanthomonas euroxanthea]CAD1790213.1 hypothetical protein XSP_001551 [Xanthomonas euroxanthea]SYZ57028.1 hypothetical protein CPBF367_36470 [Xanthomonas arboricola pv. juglandis]